VKVFNIHYSASSATQEVTVDKVLLGSGEQIESKFNRVMPPFIRQGFIKTSPELISTPVGYIPIDEDYRHQITAIFRLQALR